MIKIRNPLDSRITKIESFSEINKSGQRKSIKEKVYEILSSNPKSMRQLASVLNVERTTITRSIKDLQNLKLIEIVFVDKCQTTGRRVNFYQVVTK